MPVYHAIYNVDHVPLQITDLENTFGSHPDITKMVNDFPHNRSPLHRAIEMMRPDIVDWLLVKGATIDYGVDNTGEIIPSNKLAGRPAHLVAHLEEYYQPGMETEAKAILNHLHLNGLDVAKWPVKNQAFKQLREEWNNFSPFNSHYNEDELAVDESLDRPFSSKSSVTSSASGGSD